jgi:2-phosphosulfolactate phosphatase
LAGIGLSCRQQQHHHWRSVVKNLFTPPVEILHGIDGARRARGLAVIIDVLRAFSTACYAFAAGVETIIPVASIARALALRARRPEVILMGEKNGARPPGFDFGNSPSALLAAPLARRTIVHATTNGTRGLAAASRAEIVLTGSLVNAGALAAHIRMLRPGRVSLVCMGTLQGPAVEDTLCADYLAGLLAGRPQDAERVRQTIRNHPSTAKFFDRRQPDFPLADLELCLRIDAFAFVLKAVPHGDGLLRLEKIRIPKDRN